MPSVLDLTMVLSYQAETELATAAVRDADRDEAGWVCQERWEELRKLGQAGGWLVDHCEVPVCMLHVATPFTHHCKFPQPCNFSLAVLF